MADSAGRLVIITGMSGAGKSAALRCFEDIGYCCIDNLPPSLIPTFLLLYSQVPQSTADIAIVCDVRSGELFGNFREAVYRLMEDGIPHEVLFLDCEDDVLVTRYKESRRLPPLSAGLRLEDAIQLERQRLDPLKELATVTVDTSSLTPQQLRERLLGIYAAAEGQLPLLLTLLSFGFKYGMPADADYVFDTRFLPNPFYEEELRDLTGNDPAVSEYVLLSEHAKEYCESCLGVLKISLSNYRHVHKYSAIVAFGCTGGKHRSVALVNYAADALKRAGYRVTIQHRDIARV
jgi:UPF0042 nucleotide-binding protein